MPTATSEQLLSVAAHALRITGHRPSPATVWRWCKIGLRGGTIRLHAVHHSGRWLCTAEDFQRFIADQTAAAMVDPSAPSADLPDADDDALRAAGLL